MIKLIAADLDGTLLRDDKSLSDYTAQILRQCQVHGIKIVYATARPLRSVVQYRQTVAPDALIVHSGAVVYTDKAEPVLRFGIAYETTKQMISNLTAAHLKTSVEIDDVLYANFDPEIYWKYTQCVRTDFSDLPRRPADKILAGTADAALIAAMLPEDCYVQISEGVVALILHRDATKWNALRQLAEHWDIADDEIAAFGDDLIDAEMLRNCGYGVAVANALEEVKAAAKFTCGSNEEDGVAHWIEAHILK